MASSEGPLYLGFDLSTQQLKAIVVASDLSVVAQTKVDFDRDFGPKYGLTKGVLTNPDEGEVYAPVRMWLEAIDLVLERLKTQTTGNSIIRRIHAISGSCQQHGSVYWAHGADAALAKLASHPKQPLVDQLPPDVFSRPWAPNWQDQSTQAECDEFDAALPGGPHGLAKTTGSAAHHRFTGTQIMRIRRRWPDVYAATSRVSLVSSFLASVLLGSIAPIDISDVCGMDLWDIAAQDWSEPLLALAAGGPKEAKGLRQRLGQVRLDGGGSMGPLSKYFVERYGFAADCQVAPFTGDNPATILALPLRPLDAIVSLGTSTTFLMVTPHYKPDPSYHFFNHPTTPGQYMFMLCYKNGGLAREKVRDALPPSSDSNDVWATFNKTVIDTPVLGRDPAHAHLGLYFYLNEIVPNIPAGTWRYNCSRADGSGLTRLAPKDAWDPAQDARTIVESQALSLRLRSQALVHDLPGDASATPNAKLPAQPRRIYLVGGGSFNPAIAQVLGEVLGGAEGVYRLDVGGNACALGGAYKALWAMERGPGETFDDLIGKRWKPEGAIEKVNSGYTAEPFAEYGRVLGAFEKMELEILKEEHAKRAAKNHH